MHRRQNTKATEMRDQRVANGGTLSELKVENMRGVELHGGHRNNSLS